MPDRLAVDSTRDALLVSVRGYLDAVRAHPHTWRLILMPPEGAPDSLRARVTAAREQVFARLEASLRDGFTDGRGSPDPEITAHMASAYSDELARLVLTDPGRYPIERLMEHTTWMVDALAHQPLIGTVLRDEHALAREQRVAGGAHQAVGPPS